MSESAQSAAPDVAASQDIFDFPLKSPTKGEQADPGNVTSSVEADTTAAADDGSPSELSTFASLPDKLYVQRVWQARWENAPVAWREYMLSRRKVFGLSRAEEEKIRRNNKTFVDTPPLSGNGTLGSSLIMGTVGAFGKLLMTTFNELHTYRMELLYDSIEHRDDSQGLLTFSNHQSVMDDPFLMGALLPARILFNPELMRWGLCSLDICFQSALVSRTLKLGKAIPIQRRGGVQQSFLSDAGRKLVRGDWLHIFPEGRVRQSGMGYAKRGVGKLLAMVFEARQGLPLILPMYHEGIEQVMPQIPGSNQLESVFPRVGKNVFAMVGEPLDLTHVFHRLMPACANAGGTKTDARPCMRLYEEVADAMAITMRLLRAEMRTKVRKDHDVDLGEPFELS